VDTEVCKMWGRQARGRSIPPHGLRQASWRNGKAFSGQGRRNSAPREDVFEKFVGGFFLSRLVIRNGGKCARTECAEFLVTRLLLLFWMDYISHLPFDDSFPVTQSSDPIIEFNVNQLKQPRILHW